MALTACVFTKDIICSYQKKYIAFNRLFLYDERVSKYCQACLFLGRDSPEDNNCVSIYGTRLLVRASSAANYMPK